MSHVVVPVTIGNREDSPSTAQRKAHSRRANAVASVSLLSISLVEFILRLVKNVG